MGTPTTKVIKGGKSSNNGNDNKGAASVTETPTVDMSITQEDMKNLTVVFEFARQVNIKDVDGLSRLIIFQKSIEEKLKLIIK